MFDQSSRTFEYSAQTVFDALYTAHPTAKWGLGLLPPDPNRAPNYDVGVAMLWLLEDDTVIQEYTETILENAPPNSFASELKLIDFAMSSSAPETRLRPTASNMARARKEIAQGKAFHRVFAFSINETGLDTCIAHVSYASAGQIKPSVLGTIFAWITPKPARNLLQACADFLDHQNPTDAAQS